ncbi:MAG TPA: DMT family transporter [Ktedonobacteraceae bacterium]|jgi:drug/metabolite transporter (DMT)-like permease
MNHAFAPIVFGLAAALSWGSGDFNGGLASRRVNASRVVVAAYTVGLVLLIILALIWREPLPAPIDVVWGALAGLTGASGLIAFYTALAKGRMGIVAPVSAVLTAAIPVLFSIFTQGLPNPYQLGGFLLALLAIWLISRPEEQASGRPEGLGLALLAGCGFGLFFTLISRIHPDATFWPLAVARCTSILFLLIILSARRQPILPGVTVVPLIVLAGVLDALGNAFFVLAAHTGRLDVAAILSSLYPATTVLLAAFMLRERVTRIQAIGILFALAAVPLISV